MINVATTVLETSLVRGDADRSQSGFFARLASQFVAQRTAKARRMTAVYLEMYSDEQLVRYGWSAEQINRLRNVE